MKQVFFILVVAIMALACSNDDKQKLDPLIKISGVTSLPKSRSGEVKDSLAFITRYAWRWRAISKEWGHDTGRDFGIGSDGEWLVQRDTSNNKLLLLDVDVIDENRASGIGQFIEDLTDVVLLGVRYPEADTLIHPKDIAIIVGGLANLVSDTIGYIPNRVILDAREKITKAFHAGDYIECQRLFNEAYVFLPTTGQKWRELKAAGIE